jgi:hypothetical protein
MTIEEAIDAYKGLAPMIFKKQWWTMTNASKYFGAELQEYWFEGKNITAEVLGLLEKKDLDKNIKLFESDDPDCKV